MRRGWFHLARGASVGRVLGFSSNLLLSRWLGPIDLGLFNLVTTTVQTCDTLVRCGCDYALNFELGGEPEALDKKSGSQLVHALAQICSAMTILFAAVVGVWAVYGQGLLPLAMPASKRVIAICLLLLMILFEGISASSWEVLLVSHRTALLALKHGLFYPLRLLAAAIGAYLLGTLGAMCGWIFIALVQCFWLKWILQSRWKPFELWPPLWGSLKQLLRRGLPFYASNLLSSLIFYLLLLKVAAGAGLAEVGYLRTGQILQQVFAILPATLAPVLFLKLRAEENFADQVLIIEKPLRMIWFVLLETLFIYSVLDRVLIPLLFGDDFLAAVYSTRLLLLTSIFECLAQLLVQPFLATGKTRFYALSQNGTALIAAVLGMIWIPKTGLSAYLIVRLLYVVLPLICFAIPIARNFSELHKMRPLLICSIILTLIFTPQGYSSVILTWTPSLLIAGFAIVLITQWRDAVVIVRSLSRNTIAFSGSKVK